MGAGAFFGCNGDWACPGGVWAKPFHYPPPLPSLSTPLPKSTLRTMTNTQFITHLLFVKRPQYGALCGAAEAAAGCWGIREAGRWNSHRKTKPLSLWHVSSGAASPLIDFHPCQLEQVVLESPQQVAQKRRCQRPSHRLLASPRSWRLRFCWCRVG